MRIIATADLHYDVARGRASTRALAEEICRRGGDALLLVGDSASMDLTVLDELLRLFEDFRGERLAVAGNHELWTVNGGDSLNRYENELPAVFSRNGFHYLDSGPFMFGDVAFVGSVGWYDYSFRPSVMRIPLRFYRHKVAPGVAAHLDEYRYLDAGASDVPAASRQVTTCWTDGTRVRLPMNDREFTEHLLSKLRSHLHDVHDSADRIVAAIHHLPFHDLVPPSIVPNLAFATAYMGSEWFGEALLEFPKVVQAVSGHCHRAGRCRRGHLECRTIGSTYAEKTYEVIDI